MAIGSVLDGRYRIDAVLGTGGMGRVYRGEHTSLGRTVAIKILHADLGRNKDAAARFQREALASGRLDHPNIVGVSDFGVLDDGSLFLVMEALEGESVGDRLDREKRIPWIDAVQITRAVLAGLRHAHDRGVVHRDIKPDNIYLARKDGEQIVKILDFGIAKLVQGNSEDPASTRAGLTVGTPAYLSPEQAVGGAITPASDIYSTSVVLYEMITGRAPYEDKDPLAMLTAHVTREPPTFKEVAPDLRLPPMLEPVIRRGMQKVQKERIASALAYIQMLDEVLHEAGFVARPVQISGAHPIVPMTPPPGSLPNPFATPMPFQQLGSAPTMQAPVDPSGSAARPGSAGAFDPNLSAEMPVAQKALTIADITEPIPRKWLVVAAVVVIGAIIAALIVVATRGGGKGGDAKPLALPTPIAVDRDTRFKALVHDLQNGKTCEERQEAIPKLVELGDERAIPELKKARYRMRGGVLGIGDSNSNACLKSDAELAIKALGGSIK